MLEIRDIDKALVQKFVYRSLWVFNTD